MKVIKIIVILIFSAIILAPIATFNLEEDAISLIDNRVLASNPFSEEASTGDLTNNIENYVNDRIGFRNEMILNYTILHDRLFNKMVHPSYKYGTDGYVFGAGLTVDSVYTEFHEAFADMVKEIQVYCEQRDVPFLFVFNPAKPAVYSEYLPIGMNYDRAWVEEFFKALDERGVNYLDNTETLKEMASQGVVVFNQKYDANHWNDLGAYYGTNAMLKELQKSIPEIHINSLDELKITEVLQTSLLVSKFPINEIVPYYDFNTITYNSMKEKYTPELYMNPSYKTFGYYTNKTRLEEDAPKALVFQGSYMNNFGYKFLANAFGEYIHVHDYQNVLDFSYYYNIFKPDCVIFEVAEYTFANIYFDYQKMRDIKLNSTVKNALGGEEIKNGNDISSLDITVTNGKTLTEILWQGDDSVDAVWLVSDENEYDMKKTDDGYTVTITSEAYQSQKDNLKLIVMKNGVLSSHSIK